jgi:glycosyltransferase involved in cell wall biosynthesis
MVETKQGYDVYVLTSNLVDETTYEANRDFIGPKKAKTGQSVERGIKTMRLPALRLPLINSLYLLGMEETLVRLKPDVIICHVIPSLTSIRVARLKSRFPKVKLIFDDHMTYNNTRGGIFYHIYSLFRWVLTPVILKSADRIVAVTYETGKFMEQVYGIPKEKIEIISLGVDTTLFRRDDRVREEIRAKYDICDDDVVFIYAGKIIPEKGLHLLVEAALKMISKSPNVKIMFVGGGKNHFKSRLCEKINLSSFSDDFVFVSSVPNEELYKYYSAADVGIWPLRCSISMLEAMSCGLPVIISDKSGVLEIIDRGNGLVYRDGDVKDLAEKMKIMLDPESRKVMSLRAIEFAKENDWNVISKSFLGLVDI